MTFDMFAKKSLYLEITYISVLRMESLSTYCMCSSSEAGLRFNCCDSMRHMLYTMIMTTMTRPM